ncbi:unnamed protein product [Arabis nemorensis]|uniref:Uncharacterized protein n=1 Tax=Arabis nemorensis TaxID=586526 RepID=A0A565AUY5_9BRAS|nr:unnamed protein product [Arabis nemorensis]
MKKLKDYPSAKKEAEKVPGLEKKVAVQISAMNDLSKKVEETREMAKYAEEELEKMRAEKESLQFFHEQEMARLRSSRRHEVNQIISKSDAKLQKIKKSISDNEEANKLSALGGTDVPDDRFKELDENFKKFELDFEALDVEEVTEDDPSLVAVFKPSSGRGRGCLRKSSSS